MSIPNLQQLRKESARNESKWPWWLWSLSILAGLFILVVIAGFLAAPPVVRKKLESELSEKLHRSVTVDKVRINPLTLSVAIEGLTVKTKDGLEFVSWKRFFVNAELLPLLSHEVRFTETSLEGFEFHAYLNNDGKLNFDDLIQEYAGGEKGDAKKDATQASKPWVISVGQLHLDCKRIAFTDRSKGKTFATDIVPIAFDLKEFRTTDVAMAQGEFSADTELGEHFSWKGGLSLASLAMDGEVEVKHLALAKYAPYYGNLVRFDVLDGHADLKVSYHVAIEKGVPVVTAKDASFTLNHFQLAPRGLTEPVLVLDLLEISGATASTAEHAAAVKLVALKGGSVKVRRDAGRIDILDLLPADVASGATPAAPSNAAPAPAWKFDLGELAVSGLKVDFVDASGPRDARVSVTNLACKVSGLSTAALERDLPLDFSADIGGGGHMAVTGTVAASPVKFDLKTRLDTFPLAIASPYIEALAPLRILGGNVTVSAQASGTLPAGSAPQLAAHAEVDIADFATVDAAKGEELGGWKHLALHGVEYVSQPVAKVVVGEVVLSEPSARVVRAADKSLNVAPANKNAPVAARPAPSSSKPLPLSVAIDKVTIQQARFAFVDESIEPNVHTGVQDFGGTITGLSSANIARADVDLSGKVDGSAPFSVTGQINPLSDDAFTDLKVAFRGIDLIPVGSYVGKYAGRELSKGSASLDVKVKFSKRQLDAANVLTLDQFTLGASTNSPDATSLPVGLALSLLRDTRGKIVIDLPIQGSVDDPNFQIGRVVGRVLVNLLTKVATSPFSLIGSMFGGGGDELGYEEFAAGSAVIDATNTKKLDVVAKALKERPGLSVEIGGSFDRVLDGAALRQAALDKRVRQVLWNELRQANPGADIPSPEALSVTPEAEARVLGAFYTELAAADLSAQAAAATPVPASAPEKPKVVESPTLLRRFLNFIKGTSSGSAPPVVSAPVTAQTPGTAGPVSAPGLPSLGEIRSRLLEKTVVGDNDLRQLGNARSEAIRHFLIEKAGAAADRVFLVQPTGGDLKVKLTLK